MCVGCRVCGALLSSFSWLMTPFASSRGAGLAGAGVLGQALPLPRPVCSRPPAPRSQVREGRPWMAAGEQASRAQGLRSVSASCGLAAGQ